MKAADGPVRIKEYCEVVLDNEGHIARLNARAKEGYRVICSTPGDNEHWPTLILEREIIKKEDK